MTIAGGTGTGKINLTKAVMKVAKISSEINIQYLDRVYLERLPLLYLGIHTILSYGYFYSRTLLN